MSDTAELKSVTLKEGVSLLGVYIVCVIQEQWINGKHIPLVFSRIYQDGDGNVGYIVIAITHLHVPCGRWEATSPIPLHYIQVKNMYYTTKHKLINVFNSWINWMITIGLT